MPSSEWDTNKGNKKGKGKEGGSSRESKDRGGRENAKENWKVEGFCMSSVSFSPSRDESSDAEKPMRQFGREKQ